MFSFIFTLKLYWSQLLSGYQKQIKILETVFVTSFHRFIASENQLFSKKLNPNSEKIKTQLFRWRFSCSKEKSKLKLTNFAVRRNG